MHVLRAELGVGSSPDKLPAVPYNRWLTPGYSLFLSLWSLLFLRYWQRLNSELILEWNLSDMDKIEHERPEFKFKWANNRFTGKPEKFYPGWKRDITVVFVTIPVVGGMCIVVTFCMLFMFQLRDSFANGGWVPIAKFLALDPSSSHVSSTALRVPSLLYSVVILVFDKANGQLAKKLTALENYPTDGQYENALVMKVVILRFFNVFGPLVYLAFIRQDLVYMETQISSVMVVGMVVNNTGEVVVPWILHKFKQYLRRQAMQRRWEGRELAAVEKEATMSMYTMQKKTDDFSEIVVQFGYITLFSQVWPIAAAAALMNNMIEIRSDAIKLCYTVQRPIAEVRKNIGAWFWVMRLLSTVSIVVNSAILFTQMKEDLQRMMPGIDWDLSRNRFLYLLATLAFIYVARKTIDYLITEEPFNVRRENESAKYRRMKVLESLEERELGMTADL